MMTVRNLQKQKTLASLLRGLTEADIYDPLEISGLSMDSRSIQSGDLFLACSGTQQHGARYIPDAVEAGASAIVIDAGYELDLPRPEIPMISLKNLSGKVGVIAHRFYDRPSESIHVVGITGTNGKTSTAWFVAQVLSMHGQGVAAQQAGFIGTLGTGFVNNLKSGLNTTPDPIQVHKTLADFRDAGAEYAVVEVSSHALSQHRIAAVNFQSILFTNISRDHLDYHDSMESYSASKKRLFSDFDCDYKIINLDDELGEQIIQANNNPDNLYIYTLNPAVEFDPEHCVLGERQKNGNGFVELKLTSPWGKGSINTKLLGDFNAYNLLASFSALCLSGIEIGEVCQRLSTVKPVPGRMEVFSLSNKPMVVVDFAHSPDALAKVLNSLKEHCQGSLICLFGCGGDRDKGKRAEMGAAACRYADQIILSNDNPRTEDPAQIIEDIIAGFNDEVVFQVEMDRKKAISKAISEAGKDDIVLVAGKGHENTQQVGSEYFPLSDRQCVDECLEKNT